MSVKSIRLLPIFLVFGLVTILGACTPPTEDVTSPDNGAAQEGVVDSEVPAQTTEAE
ncbi:MAG: hypothetical protein QNJ34_12490 [Xenococcaceae cyanobacterium MO_188.B29]|nr:hypothetical protein [Xenococcaceae cyanobacterium MO_188.B29]